MKTSRSTTNKQSKQGASKKPRPEVRDDLDSRKEKAKTKDKTAKVKKGVVVKNTPTDEGKPGVENEVNTKKPIKKKAKK
jgi:hypothetical protein